jgi:hypothetical protein
LGRVKRFNKRCIPFDQRPPRLPSVRRREVSFLVEIKLLILPGMGEFVNDNGAKFRCQLSASNVQPFFVGKIDSATVREDPLQQIELTVPCPEE